MSLAARLVAVVGVLVLAGCAASEPPNMSVSEIGGLRLTEVRIDIPPGALINYTPAEMELAQAKGVSPSDGPAIDALVKSPEGASFVRERAAEKIRSVMLNEVGPVMNGARPVRLEVSVKQIDIPGAGRNIATALLLGSHDASVALHVTVSDARSGKPMIEGHDLVAIEAIGGGVIGLATVAAMEAAGAVDSPYDRLVRKSAKDYARWLKQGAS